MPIQKSFADFDNLLRQHAIGLFTAFDVFTYDPALNQLSETSDADNIRNKLAEKYQLIPLWLSFSVGIECLVKSVLLKHHNLQILKKVDNQDVKGSIKKLKKDATNYNKALDVFNFMLNFEIAFSASPNFIETELINKRVKLIYDIDIKTLGAVLYQLTELQKIGIIDQNQHDCLFNSLFVLLHLRRNIDVHTFHGFTVGRSINGELENLYMPAVNLLLKL